MNRELKLQMILLDFYGNLKKHLQVIGAATSLKSIVSLLYLYCGKETSIPFV